MTNRKISLLMVLLILCSSGVSYADNHNYYKEDMNRLQYVLDGNDYYPRSQYVLDENHYRPTEIVHHTCGLGGTNCAECRYKTLIKPCGCILYVYICCCGSEMSVEYLLCPEHYK